MSRRQRVGEGDVVLPRWAVAGLAGGSALSLLLGTFLYSARTQRRTRDSPRDLESLDDLSRALEGMVRAWRVEGNSLQLLHDGDGFFPALLGAIESAEDSVHIESYAWWTGEICDRLAALLCRKAQQGVEVRLLMDWLGSIQMPGGIDRRLRDAGVAFERYHAFGLRSIGRLNQRDHRKLAVIDGHVGFIFSHGFARQWEGCGDGPESWRDTGARIEGPIVGNIQSLFAESWLEASSEMLAHSRYFPPLERRGDVTLQLIAASPRGGVSSVSLLYRLLIAMAQDELLIQNPYFAPDHDWVDLLIDAVERGVRVRIMVPGPHTDSLMVKYAGHHQYEKLLRGGVEIWEHQRTLIHQKVVVLDRRWAHLGSTNFDERSFDINQEVSLGIWDEAIAEQLRQKFFEDLEHCELCTVESWRQRPWYRRLRDAAVWAVHEQI